MGKVLGIGVLGVVQLAVFVTAALIAAAGDATDWCCPRPRRARSCCSPSGSSSATCCTRPRSGSSARSRRGMEEASNASTPVTMVAMISYFVAIFAVVDDPDGTGRDDRHVPAAVGAVRRPAAGRLRCHPAVADRRCPRSSRSSASGCCSRSARGSTRGPCCRSAGG